MSLQPLIVALEGPCCAGKTTLGRLLVQKLCGLAVAFVPCYADHAGGGRFLPRQEAGSVAEREQALRQLLLVEAGRLAQVPHGCDVILEDRSVHTLLANSYALQRKTGTSLLAPSARLLRSSPVPAWPDLVLYLDLPQDAVQGRNPGKFPPGSIYTDPDFNAAVRAYFRRLAGWKTPPVAWLDATLELPELARLAAARVRHETGQELVKGASWTRCRCRDG
jgi:thymidylate kinase